MVCGASTLRKKSPGVVILSEAKDLHLLVFKEVLQMLRFAPLSMTDDLFSQPARS
jgi:hypothetical protein